MLACCPLCSPTAAPLNLVPTSANLVPTSANLVPLPTIDNALINALLLHHIEPMITLYHWDYPLVLEQRFGGWIGPKRLAVGTFARFARAAFALFGDRVKKWVTINECASPNHTLNSAPLGYV